MEHRMGERLNVNQPISLNVSNREPINGRLVDISISGVSIKCEEWSDLNLYTPVEIVVKPDDGLQPEVVKIMGFVVRLQNDMVGLTFMHEVVEPVNRLRSNG